MAQKLAGYQDYIRLKALEGKEIIRRCRSLTEEDTSKVVAREVGRAGPRQKKRWANLRAVPLFHYSSTIMLRVEKPLARHKYENWEHLRLPKSKESFPVTARGAPQIEQLICNSRKRFALLFAVSRTVASTRYFCNPAFAQRCNALRSFAARFWPTKMDRKKSLRWFCQALAYIEIS